MEAVMFNFLRLRGFVEDKLKLNLVDELGEPPEMLKWRVGCLCVDCSTSREESLQKHATELNICNA